MNLDLATISLRELAQLLSGGQVTAREVVESYLDRIDALDRNGPLLRSVIEVNPAALDIADALDRRPPGESRGPLHGVPILLKDNIDTADAMLTTAGSLALTESRPARDAFVAARLRAAGAIFLGKTNLSEWANFRSTHSSSGWSARGGQARNPYVLDRSPCGSSSGSAVAVAAGLCAASVGTETDGSILCPAAFCGIVGIKPTVGLLSRSGLIPIAHSQDTPGPMARTVADAALLLGVLAGVDPDDPVTQSSARRSPADYTQFLASDGLKSARIGVARAVYFGVSEKASRIVEDALQAMRSLGAEIVDPADIPSAKELDEDQGELEVLLYEFKADLNSYLAARDDPQVKSLEDLIAFNEGHADQELRYFGQEQFLAAQDKGPLTDERYLEALHRIQRLARADGIDAVMDELNLDALVAPTTAPPFMIDVVDGDHHLGASTQPTAVAGYPAITVPAGYSFGLPVGISFIGRAYSEPTLIKLAYAFEQATQVWRPPQYLPTLDESTM